MVAMDLFILSSLFPSLVRGMSQWVIGSDFMPGACTVTAILVGDH